MSSPERENVVARLHSHRRALIVPTIVLIALAGACGYLPSVLTEQWQAVALAVVATVVLIVGWAVPLLRWASSTAQLSTRRLVVRHGILARRREELSLSRVSHVELRRRGLQLLFRSADVLVHAAGSTLVITDVASPRLVQEAILELAETEPRFEG